MELLESQLVELINQIQSLAPRMWEILMKQALIDGWWGIVWVIVWGIALLLPILPSAFVAKSFYKRYRAKNVKGSYYDDEFALLVGLLGCYVVIVLIMGLCILSDGVRVMANPEWHAIQLLIGGLQ